MLKHAQKTNKHKHIVKYNNVSSIVKNQFQVLVLYFKCPNLDKIESREHAIMTIRSSKSNIKENSFLNNIDNMI